MTSRPGAQSGVKLCPALFGLPAIVAEQRPMLVTYQERKQVDLQLQN